ncbi:MAG: PAS domain-containing protein, partial [Rhodospirillaceae bacterium]|nr:PAS domain-containing protein [Rhodospirillaceae bacterium]
RQREIQQWQIRLGIVADSRAAAVNEWIGQNFGYVRELSQNASLQVYLSTLTEGGGEETAAEPEVPRTEGADASDDLPLNDDLPSDSEGSEEAGGGASASYLRNLLVATAERTGFKAPAPVGEIAANVERAGVAGLGLVDKDGQAIVSTPDMPPMTRKIRAAVAKALDGEPAIIDLFIGAGGDPTMGFVLPIYGIQDDSSAGAKGIGAVVGMRVVGKDLWNRLKQPGETAKSAETYIVRAAGAIIQYLTPLADGTPAMKRSLSTDTPELAAANALAKPGSFGLLKDYTGTNALAASRPIAELPWVLIRKIGRDEALAATDSRLRVILIVFISVIVIVTLAVLFVWKKGASVRATQALHDAQVALERFTNMGKFMQVVTNNQPNIIVAVDEATHFTFANEPAADGTGIEPSDMMGKTMASVWGPQRSQAFAEINKSVISSFENETHTLSFGDPDNDDAEGEERFQVIRSHHVPLRGDRDFPPAALMILSDVTELTAEKRRGERMMNELIDTLVTVVDRRDPFSANHSTRVAEVSRAMAQEMELTEVEVKTVETAGKLMNLGKIFIPPETLVKSNDLTDEERSMLANAYLTTVDLLEGVTFDGPVVESIRQLGETWDGNGPLGLKGDEILVTARILSVANAFVGMISARAYRGAMPFRKAADILTEDTDTRYDRRPVSALVNFLENRDGMHRWSHFRDAPTAEAAE